jgi:hypothetical protein
MGIYNGVWEHLYRRYVKGELSASDRAALLPSYDDLNTHSNIPTGAGVFVPTEKDSINKN